MRAEYGCLGDAQAGAARCAPTKPSEIALERRTLLPRQGKPEIHSTAKTSGAGGLRALRVVEFGVPVRAALRCQVEHVPERPQQVEVALVDAGGELGVRAVEVACAFRARNKRRNATSLGEGCLT